MSETRKTPEGKRSRRLTRDDIRKLFERYEAGTHARDERRVGRRVGRT